MIHNIWHRALYMMCYCSSHCLYGAWGSAAGVAGSRLWIHANKCVCWSGCTQAPAPSHSCSFSPLLPNYASQNIHLLDFIMASLVSHGSPWEKLCCTPERWRPLTCLSKHIILKSPGGAPAAEAGRTAASAGISSSLHIKWISGGGSERLCGCSFWSALRAHLRVCCCSSRDTCVEFRVKMCRHVRHLQCAHAFMRCFLW